MQYQSSFSIDKLIENLGLKESRELLAEALPIIIARKIAILKALQQNNISVASQESHKASGSVRLYGSSRLEALLLEVISLPPKQSVKPSLGHQLEAEFDDVIHEIQLRLK